MVPRKKGAAGGLTGGHSGRGGDQKTSTRGDG